MTPEQRARLDNLRRDFEETPEEWRDGGSGSDAACSLESTCECLFQLVKDVSRESEKNQEN